VGLLQGRKSNSAAADAPAYWHTGASLGKTRVPEQSVRGYQRLPSGQPASVLSSKNRSCSACMQTQGVRPRASELTLVGSVSPLLTN